MPLDTGPTKNFVNKFHKSKEKKKSMFGKKKSDDDSEGKKSKFGKFFGKK